MEAPMMASFSGHTFASRTKWLLRQKALWAGLVLWLLLGLALVVFGGRKLPLKMIEDHTMTALQHVIGSLIELVILFVMMGIVQLIARRRSYPDLAARAPERAVAARETTWLCIYAAAVLGFGQWLGLRLFGEGIGLHLNGCITGATRVQSPTEVWTWAFYNFVLYALIPYMVFRSRGYSRGQVNLRSTDWKNDTLIVLVVLLIGCGLELLGPNIFQLTPHQQIVGGSLSFFVHLLGTDLPVMIFIYAILVPRYYRLFSPCVAYLLGAVSYPALHIFESWANYDTPMDGLISVIFAFFVFFPAGLMKSYLTMRTGNAWVHMWAYHAFTPHVMVDTRLVVKDFNI
jgi:hypothetical protein